ncbi:MAG: alpha/beta hydrolase [Burkholderiaceae bacterium]|nr:alpha/beta hydrolase [Burkholderiaceae bacterium]
MTEARRAAPVLAALALALALALTGCVALPPPQTPPAGVTRAFDRLPLAGAVLDAEWHLPAGEPRAWVLLQHGFARRCANLRGTAAELAAQGVATLCLNADQDAGVAGGAPQLAEALARWWLSPAARAPDGRAAPPRVVVAGHSAGGLFAARVGAAVAAQAPERLAGALLFDPVGGAALRQALLAMAGRPLHATLAPPVPCNARQLARPALQAAGVALVEPPGATHVDAEGEDGDSAAVRACREGPPRPEAVAALRRWAAAALDAMLR